MTLLGTLTAAVAVILSIAAASAGVGMVRADLKRRQTRELLALLNEALAAYTAMTGEMADPSAPEPAEFSGGVDADSGSRDEQAGRTDEGVVTRQVIELLYAAGASRAVLERIPEVLRCPYSVGGDPSRKSMFTFRAPHSEPSGFPSWTLQDAWGRPLACVVPSSGSAHDRLAAAANGGQPVFISAGEDGRFHSADGPAEADNLRSDEVP